MLVGIFEFVGFEGFFWYFGGLFLVLLLSSMSGFRRYMCPLRTIWILLCYPIYSLLGMSFVCDKPHV